MPPPMEKEKERAVRKYQGNGLDTAHGERSSVEERAVICN